MERSCFLSLPVCACSGFGEIASVHINIQERRMRAREPTPAVSMWSLLPSSEGYRDVWDEGWSVPIRRGRRQMLGGKHGCSPLREAQVPDEGSAFLGGTGSAKHMLHPGLSPAEEGSRGCSHTAYVGATTLFKELQSTLAKKVITHRSHQLRCGGRDDVHTNSGLIFFSFFLFWHEMSYMALPILCPSEPAGCWCFSSVPWQKLTLFFAKQMCQQILAGVSPHALFR